MHVECTYGLTCAIAVRACVSCVNNHLEITYVDVQPKNTVIYIIESVDSISRDERDAPLTQYITNAGISHVRYLSRILNTTIVFYG